MYELFFFENLRKENLKHVASLVFCFSKIYISLNICNKVITIHCSEFIVFGNYTCVIQYFSGIENWVFGISYY